MKIAFIETDIFSSRIKRLGLEEDLRELQLTLLENPETGRLDSGTGGLRKVRMSSARKGKGKSGGARAHYLHVPHVSRIYMIFVYSKDEDDTLSPKQKRALSNLVSRIKAESRAAGPKMGK